MYSANGFLAFQIYKMRARAFILYVGSVGSLCSLWQRRRKISLPHGCLSVQYHKTVNIRSWKNTFSFSKALEFGALLIQHMPGRVGSYQTMNMNMDANIWHRKYIKYN